MVRTGQQGKITSAWESDKERGSRCGLTWLFPQAHDRCTDYRVNQGIRQRDDEPDEVEARRACLGRCK
jgi:hypothetical protein